MIKLVEEDLCTLGFVQTIKGATRSWPGDQDTLIDQVWTNCSDRLQETRNIVRASSDHNVVAAKVKDRKQNLEAHPVRKRSLKNFKEEEYLTEVRKVNWGAILEINNLDMAVHFFTSNMTRILDKLAPIRTFQSRARYARWLTEETREKMKERDRARETARRTRRDEDWAEYRRRRNECTKDQRKEKDVHMKETFKASEEDCSGSKMWGLVKCHLGWTAGGPPTHLQEGASMITSPRKMCEIMNKYYVEKIRKIRQQFGEEDGDPLEVLRGAMSRWDGRPGEEDKFKLRIITKEDTRSMMRKLKGSKAAGVDEIDASMLKMASEHLEEPLTYIINLSILQGRFPNKWKLGRILPLSKMKDEGLPKGYRPVCLLPAASKILEMVIVTQVASFMDKSLQYNPNHHAYRANHSTCTAMLQLSDQWLDATNRGEQSASMMLDMSAAFDCVDHDLLDKKLNLYGFHRESRAWISSYLSHRSQQVTLGGQFSEFLAVPTGVPQGSCLGPILYTIFTNKIPEIPKDHVSCQDEAHREKKRGLFGRSCRRCGIVTCYADDSTYNISSREDDRIQERLEEITRKFCAFLKANKLQLNDDKTVLVRMTTFQQHNWNPRETLALVAQNGKVVEPVVETRLLGAIISNDLTWRSHCISGKDSLVKQLSKKIGALKMVCRRLSHKSRLALANGIVMSRLLYLIPVWGGDIFGDHKEAADHAELCSEDGAREGEEDEGERAAEELWMDECEAAGGAALHNPAVEDCEDGQPNVLQGSGEG
jgi:hypothetical protein